jgi:hypothetical protein
MGEEGRFVTITKEELLQLKTKILPQGAEMIVDLLASRHTQVEITHIVLENVPLLIIGRHGMIARLYSNGVVQKVSQPAEVYEKLQAFFQKQEKLYLFINLPDLRFPSEVTELIREVESRAQRKEELKRIIDEALDRRDMKKFYEATEELRRLNAPEPDDGLFPNRG